VVTFCIDISPTMGAKRKIVEEVNIPSSNQQTQTTRRERETTDLEWVNEFVAKKIQSYVSVEAVGHREHQHSFKLCFNRY
jgi:CO/xanthine dehydrogenase FAD-binding subunit